MPERSLRMEVPRAKSGILQCYGESGGSVFRIPIPLRIGSVGGVFRVGRSWCFAVAVVFGVVVRSRVQVGLRPRHSARYPTDPLTWLTMVHYPDPNSNWRLFNCQMLTVTIWFLYDSVPKRSAFLKYVFTTHKI